MSNTLPQSDTSKSVRVTVDVWESVSHESVDRRASIAVLLGAAWRQFMLMPLGRREKLIAEFESSKERAA